jgi:hypothetical protein
MQEVALSLNVTLMIWTLHLIEGVGTVLKMEQRRLAGILVRTDPSSPTHRPAEPSWISRTEQKPKFVGTLISVKSQHFLLDLQRLPRENLLLPQISSRDALWTTVLAAQPQVPSVFA